MLFAATSAATEPSRGWGGPLAILCAFAVFRVGQYVAVRRGWIKISNPSPPPALPTAERVKVQATVGVTPDDTTDTTPEEGWWGRIREVGGVRFRQAEQVWRTGSHELPADDPVPADDEPDDGLDIDLALEDEEAEEPRDPVTEYIDRADRLQIPYGQMVKVLKDSYGISESTAKRRIREARAERAERG